MVLGHEQATRRTEYLEPREWNRDKKRKIEKEREIQREREREKQSVEWPKKQRHITLLFRYLLRVTLNKREVGLQQLHRTVLAVNDICLGFVRVIFVTSRKLAGCRYTFHSFFGLCKGPLLFKRHARNDPRENPFYYYRELLSWFAHPQRDFRETVRRLLGE